MSDELMHQAREAANRFYWHSDTCEICDELTKRLYDFAQKAVEQAEAERKREADVSKLAVAVEALTDIERTCHGDMAGQAEYYAREALAKLGAM